MLVQLSPWETFRTSIRIPASSRRRKRDVKNEEQKSCPSFTASMVSTASKRSLSRMKLKAAELRDCLPFLTITVDHHITILGKNLAKDEISSSYREFSSLRYNSRPGDAGSFFASPSTGVCSGIRLPHIPAVLDTKNDRMYAFQQENTKLTCWNAWKCSGPDDKSALKIHLEHPALSMKLLPMSKGIIYGSCENGVVYFASVVGEKILVEYLPVGKDKGNVNIGTFAEIEIEEAKMFGRKRKLSDSDDTLSVNLYQVFCNDASIMIVRNNISLSTSNSEKIINSGSLVQKTALVDLLSDDALYQRSNYAVDRVGLLISSSDYAPKISVVYTVSNVLADSSKDKSEDRCCGTFCAAISLRNGAISNSPVRLPSKTNKFGLVKETVLAAASSEMIYVCDLITGSVLQRKSLKHILSDIGRDNEWALHTNDKQEILTVLFLKDDYLHVASSTTSFDGKNFDMSLKKLKSSSKLASSLITNLGGSSGEQTRNYDQVSGTIAERDTNVISDLIRLDESVARALSTLEKTRRDIISGNSELCSRISFREVFDVCLSNVIRDVNRSTKEHEVCVSKYGNHQVSYNTELKSQTRIMKNPKSNGISKFYINTKNKGQNISSCIPQSFIDGSAEIVLSIILKGKQDTSGNPAVDKLGLDARLVLKDLILSKRVSARSHFEGSCVRDKTGKRHPLSMILKAFEDINLDNPLSSLQIIVEMIANCSDLSERHLVVMLDYMIRHAKADCIIDTVRHHNTGNVAKEYKLMKGHEQKTIVAGVRAILQMIVGYSVCNEAMLRAALFEELNSSTEALILARMLPNLLIASSYDNLAKHCVRSACQWISALSESYRDDLTWTKTSSGINYLNTLLNSVEKITKNSQAVMVLKDRIGEAEMKKKDKKIRKKNGVDETSRVEEMCEYSIDHIIF
mmetsp:Transcript_2863/g.7861  ORF Transcript_2863/g.7861 Transcript_2863/m.7861 type:complete len:915 (+) Transcript_2863:107-2851(+)